MQGRLRLAQHASLDAVLSRDPIGNLPDTAAGSPPEIEFRLGKVRGKVEAAQDISEAEAIKVAKAADNVGKWIAGKEVVKEIYVPGKIVNIVVK